MWSNSDSRSVLVGMQNDTALWKIIGQFLKTLNVPFPQDPEIVLPSMYPRKLKIYIHTKTST